MLIAYREGVILRVAIGLRIWRQPALVTVDSGAELHQRSIRYQSITAISPRVAGFHGSQLDP